LSREWGGSAAALLFQITTADARRSTPNSKAITDTGVIQRPPWRDRSQTSYTDSTLTVHAANGRVASVKRNGVRESRYQG
jgi:hypothetical protein